VIARVPVARGDHEVEAIRRRELVESLADLVPVRNRERAAGREVVLEVDDHECFGHGVRVEVGAMLPPAFACCAAGHRGSVGQRRRTTKPYRTA
jgi:hypothetical protein